MATRGRYTNGVLEYYESTTGEVVRRETAVQLREEFTCVDRLDTTTSNNGFMVTLAGNNDSIIIASSKDKVGIARVGTGTVDNDTTLIHSVTGVTSTISPAIQAILAPVAIANMAISVGFCTIAGLVNAGPLKQVGTTWTTTGTDLVGILYDPLASVATYQCIATNNNTDATAINTSVAPVDGRFDCLRVDLQDNGTATTAKCYVNGVLKATFATAVRRTVDLYAYVAFSTRNNAGAQLVDVDRCRFWSN